MTNANYDEEFATRVISAIETRIDRKLKSGAQIQYTWGQVSSVATDGQTAGVFFYGETDSANESGAVRLPGTTFVTVGDAVKVAIDYATGDRWVVEVDTPVGKKLITVDTDTGSIRLGSVGASSDLTLSRVAAGRLDLTALTPGISLNSTSGDYAYIKIHNSAGAARFLLDYGTGTSDDVRLGLYSGAAGAETFAPYISLVASGSVDVTPSLHAQNSLYVNLGSDATVGNAVFAIKGTQAGHTADYTMMVYESATYGAVMQFGLGDASGSRDTNLYRSAANTLKTDDALIVLGSIQQGADSTDSIKMGGGSIELFSSNPFIDFKNAAGDDYDARIIYNLSSSGKLVFYGAPILFNVARIETSVALMNGGSVSFPASPTTNDRYWRTDLKMEFFYDGARWVSTTLFSQPLHFRVTESYAATTYDSYRSGVPYLTAGGIYIEDWTCNWYTTTGTLNSTNKWVDTLFLHGKDGGADGATLGTNTCDSGAAAQYHRNQIAINAVADLDSYATFTVTSTLTGTNGVHYLWSLVSYRHIAT